MALASPQPRTPVDQEAEFDDHRSAPPSAGPGSDAGQEFGGLEMSHASAAKIPAPERMLSRAMSATSHGDSAMVRMEDAMAKHLAVPDVVEPLVPKNLTAAESTADWMSSWVRQDLYRLSALDASSAGASGRKRIFYPGGGVFEGDLSDGYWHGAGKLRFDSGEIYVGSFRNERMHGKGKFVDTQGNAFEGRFVDGIPHGEGQHIFENGELYHGGYERGVFHGTGSYSWPDGRRYMGDFRQGKIHGRGRFTYKNGDYYDGGWDQEEMHGQGIKREGGRDYNVLHEHGVIIAFAKPLMLYSHVVPRDGFEESLDPKPSRANPPRSTTGEDWT